MTKVLGVRQFATLLLSVSMVAVGYLGLTGELTNHTLVTAAILTIMVVLAFSLGQQSFRLKNN